MDAPRKRTRSRRCGSRPSRSGSSTAWRRNGSSTCSGCGKRARRWRRRRRALVRRASRGPARAAPGARAARRRGTRARLPREGRCRRGGPGARDATRGFPDRGGTGAAQARAADGGARAAGLRGTRRIGRARAAEEDGEPPKDDTRREGSRQARDRLKELRAEAREADAAVRAAEREAERAEKEAGAARRRAEEAAQNPAEAEEEVERLS